MDHLSSLDASFLHLETPETPMHVGSLHVLELPQGYRGDFYEAVKAQLARRLHVARVLHRKLASMPFELADPVWIEDEDIDLTRASLLIARTEYPDLDIESHAARPA